MIRTKRALLLSCSVVLLCVSLIVGATYALFTGEVTTTNHLQAGNLTVELTRTKLTYKVLNGDGYLQEFTDNASVDFSELTEENVFGLTDDVLIAPESFFEAEMHIENRGTVAFTYTVDIQLNSACDPEIADQLLITVTNAAGTKVIDEKPLSEFTASTLANEGEVVAGGQSQTFTVRVDFLNDTTVNDDAQDQTGIFDMFVKAEQAIS